MEAELILRGAGPGFFGYHRRGVEKPRNRLSVAPLSGQKRQDGCVPIR